MIAHRTENQISPLPVIGEIFLRVIDDVAAPIERTRSKSPGAAHASNLSPEGFGNLHGKRTYAAGCPIDQNLLPR